MHQSAVGALFFVVVVVLNDQRRHTRSSSTAGAPFPLHIIFFISVVRNKLICYYYRHRSTRADRYRSRIRGCCTYSSHRYNNIYRSTTYRYRYYRLLTCVLMGGEMAITPLRFFLIFNFAI